MQIAETPLPQHRSLRILAAAAVICAVFLWGSSFAATKFALGYYPPLAVVAARMAIASILVLPLLGTVKKPDYRKGDWRWLALLALLQPCLYFYLETNALVYTTSSQAGMISALVPLLVVLGARLFLSEYLSGHMLAGVALSITGVIIMTVAGGSQDGAANPLLGNTLEFAAMCCAAGYMLTLKKLSARFHAFHLTGFQFITGAVVFAPFLFTLTADTGEAFALKPLGSLVFLGVFVTFAAFMFFNYAISKLPAGRVSVMVNLIPAVAVMMGWLVMDETLNPVQWAAIAIIMAGVAISQRNRSS